MADSSGQQIVLAATEAVEDPDLLVWVDMVQDATLSDSAIVKRGEIPKGVRTRLDALIAKMQVAGKYNKLRCSGGQDCFVHYPKATSTDYCGLCGLKTVPDGSDKYRVLAKMGKACTFKGQPVKYICVNCFPVWVEDWGHGYKPCAGEACTMWRRMASPEDTCTSVLVAVQRSATRASSSSAPPPPPAPPPGLPLPVLLSRVEALESRMAVLENQIQELTVAHDDNANDDNANDDNENDDNANENQIQVEVVNENDDNANDGHTNQ